MIAGYETSSTALAYLAHVLRKNPDIQEKLADEIQHFRKLEDAKGNER